MSGKVKKFDWESRRRLKFYPKIAPQAKLWFRNDSDFWPKIHVLTSKQCCHELEIWARELVKSVENYRSKLVKSVNSSNWYLLECDKQYSEIFEYFHSNVFKKSMYSRVNISRVEKFVRELVKTVTSSRVTRVARQHCFKSTSGELPLLLSIVWTSSCLDIKLSYRSPARWIDR